MNITIDCEMHGYWNLEAHELISYFLKVKMEKLKIVVELSMLNDDTEIII